MKIYLLASIILCGAVNGVRAGDADDRGKAERDFSALPALDYSSIRQSQGVSERASIQAHPIYGAACCVDRLNQLYGNAQSGGSVSASLAMTAAMTRKRIEEINGLYAQSAGASDASAMLVFASAATGKSIGELNELYSKAAGAGVTSAMLAMTSAFTGKPMDEINGLYSDAASAGSASAVLTFAAARYDCEKTAAAHDDFRVLFFPLSCGKNCTTEALIAWPSELKH